MKTREKTIKRNILYKGKVVNFGVDNILLPNNKEGTREYVEHSGGAAILVIKNDLVYLVEQFRYPFKENLLEIPAGKLDKNEKPESAAKRELREELGLIAKNLVHLGDIYPSVGYTNEIIHLYFVKEFEKEHQNLDNDEFINVKKINVKEFDLLIKNNKIKDAKTISAYLMYKNL